MRPPGASWPPDLEALLQAETIGVQAGPRPFEDETVLAAVRESLKALSTLTFRYEGGSTPGRTREVTPYGVLFGRANYLVAAEGEGGPRNWRLDRLHEVAVTGRPGARPPGFSLQDYADESFGIYQDDTEDVVLRILPASAEGALRWRFHANQQVEAQPDGRGDRPLPGQRHARTGLAPLHLGRPGAGARPHAAQGLARRADRDRPPRPCVRN